MLHEISLAMFSVITEHSLLIFSSSFELLWIADFEFDQRTGFDIFVIVFFFQFKPVL